MTEKIKREECHVGIYPCCIEFENGKVIRNCYDCIEKYGYAKGVYKENQKNIRTWKEVLNEVEETKEHATDLVRPKILVGKIKELTDMCFDEAIRIINKKLSEVEDGRNNKS